MLTAEIKSAKLLTPAESQEVNALMNKIFAGEPEVFICAPADWFIWLRKDGVIISVLAIIERTVSVAGQPVKVGGVGGVGTDPAYRGRGYASQMMCAAIDHIHTAIEADFGLLFCDSHRVSFYTVLGWEVINDQVTYDQPSGKVQNKGISMVYALTRRPWPKGPVDINGYPW